MVLRLLVQQIIEDKDNHNTFCCTDGQLAIINYIEINLNCSHVKSSYLTFQRFTLKAACHPCIIINVRMTNDYPTVKQHKIF